MSGCPAAGLGRRETGHRHFPLLSDPGRAVLTAYGAYGETSPYDKTVTGVVRSTVVVDGAGTVEWASYDVRAKGHVAKLARELGLVRPGGPA